MRAPKHDIMILFLAIILAMVVSSVTGMEKNMPYWFGYLFGGMCYTFVHFFFFLVAGYIAARRQQKMFEKKGTGWNNLTDTGDVQKDIEKFASGLRQSGLLAASPRDKEMYVEFEGLFNEFSDKLKSVNEKYTEKKENSTAA